MAVSNRTNSNTSSLVPEISAVQQTQDWQHSMNHHQFTVSVTSTLNPAIQYFHKTYDDDESSNFGCSELCLRFFGCLCKLSTPKNWTRNHTQTMSNLHASYKQLLSVYIYTTQEITQVLPGFKTTARSDNFRCWCCWRKVFCAALAVQYLSISTHISSFLSLQKQTNKQNRLPC